MNLRAIDLNLLVIFDALIEDKSITRAARRVGVTPSAISHALQRLRQTFDDPLLERTATGMVPTVRARDLAKSVRAALRELEHGIGQQLEFDPATSQRTFNLQIAALTAGCLLPRVCARVRAEAPGITLVACLQPDDTEDSDDTGGSYAAGDIQLRISGRRLTPDISHQPIWRDRLVIAMRRDHPAASLPMTLELYAGLAQIAVSTAVIDTRRLDDELRRKGLAHRHAVTVLDLASAIPIVAQTDLCMVVPERCTTLYGPLRELAAVPLPFEDVAHAVDLIWHRRDERDAGHRWLRTLIVEESAPLLAPGMHPAG